MEGGYCVKIMEFQCQQPEHYIAVSVRLVPLPSAVHYDVTVRTPVRQCNRLDFLKSTFMLVINMRSDAVILGLVTLG
jgi:hypothetical protein